jgi:hypothetical protein
MKVKELLTGPEKWTQGACARDRKGESALATDAHPRYDLMGAMIRCYGFKGYPAVYERARVAVGRSPVAWNDAPERTFQDVKHLVNELDI